MFCSRPRLRCCASLPSSFERPTSGRTRTVRTSSGSIPRFDAGHARKARQEQSRTDEQDDRERDLDGDERTAQPLVGRRSPCSRAIPASRPRRPAHGRTEAPGRALKSRPLTMAIATVVASTRRSTAMAATAARPPGSPRRSASTPSHAPNAPSAAPPSDRRRLSTSRARTRSQREAPSADRITSSRLRALRAGEHQRGEVHAGDEQDEARPRPRSMNIHVRTPRVR